MKIGVIGTGYVGLVTGTCFSDLEHEVICMDIIEEKINKLKKGILPIYEPGLEELVLKNSENGNLKFTTNLQEIVDHAQIIFMCLPTPPKADGSADLKYLLAASTSIAEIVQNPVIIVNKSTVPVGTADLVQEVFTKHGKNMAMVVSNPEFLREGSAVWDFKNPERVVVGTNNQEAVNIMHELYQTVVQDHEKIVFMDLKSSEMSKYAANSFLATKISFINEVANLCDKLGANVEKVAYSMGLDTRIGSKFLNAGIGYGGSCFPKDVSAMFETGKQYSCRLEILDAVMRVNEKQKSLFMEKIVSYYSEMSDLTLAVWGLAFKSNTDDLRESPAVEIIRRLLQFGVKIVAFDPQVSEKRDYIKDMDIKVVENKYHALDQADGLLILTEWLEFRDIDWAILSEKMTSKVIFDGKNLLELEQVPADFIYTSVGR
jgi:UDPglucose 6-dehydrogenase